MVLEAQRSLVVSSARLALAQKFKLRQGPLRPPQLDLSPGHDDRSGLHRRTTGASETTAWSFDVTLRSAKRSLWHCDPCLPLFVIRKGNHRPHWKYTAVCFTRYQGELYYEEHTERHNDMLRKAKGYIKSMLTIEGFERDGIVGRQKEKCLCYYDHRHV
jgi:hypothetical protein